MRIFHVALRSEWEDAQRCGSYTTSTLGVSLAEEGFIHASREDQWRGVMQRFYTGVTEPLVLLEIDTDRLSSPVVEETPAGANETFPHIYGPLEPEAVVRVVPIERGGSFSALFLQEMFRNVVLATIVLVCAVAGARGLEALLGGWGPLAGAAAGTLVGVVGARAWARRRRR